MSKCFTKKCQNIKSIWYNIWPDDRYTQKNHY